MRLQARGRRVFPPSSNHPFPKNKISDSGYLKAPCKMGPARLPKQHWKPSLLWLLPLNPTAVPMATPLMVYGCQQTAPGLAEIHKSGEDGRRWLPNVV